MPGAFSWTFPRLLAHRGGGSLAPENTLAAFETGLRLGYRAAEVDAVLSADAVPVLLHDETLDRTSSGRGSVARVSAAELARLDAGSWFGPEFAGVGIPTLEQALRFCRERGMWLNVEIKPVAGFEEATGTIVAQLCAACSLHPSAGEPPPPLLSSFSRISLEAARRAAPHLARGLLCTRIPADWRQALVALDCSTVHCDHRHLTQAQAKAVRSGGYGLLCYTVNEPGRAATLRRWGVDAICTDRIDLLRPGFGIG